jgi:hypothetical protein
MLRIHNQTKRAISTIAKHTILTSFLHPSQSAVADCGATAPYQRVAGQRACLQLATSTSSDAISATTETKLNSQNNDKVNRDHRGFGFIVMVSPNKGNLIPYRTCRMC